MLIKIITLNKEFSWLGVKSSSNEYISLRGNNVSTTIRNIEFILDHNCLGHVIHDFVGINELSPGFQVKNSGKNVLIKSIFQLEISGEMLCEKLVQFLLNLFWWSAIGKWKIIVLSVHREILGNYIVKFVYHACYCLYFIWIYFRIALLNFRTVSCRFEISIRQTIFRFFSVFLLFFLSVFIQFWELFLLG